MRTTTLISVLLAGTLLLSGCDFFRSLAGRPTSRDIQAKLVKIEEQEAAREAELKRRADSVALVQKQTADSLEAMEFIRTAGRTVLAGIKVSQKSAREMDKRYYVMIGSFGNAENADKQASKAAEAGYEAKIILLQSGFTAVGVNPSNSIADAYASLTKVLNEKFCPADAWILDMQY